MNIKPIIAAVCLAASISFAAGYSAARSDYLVNQFNAAIESGCMDSGGLLPTDYCLETYSDFVGMVDADYGRGN